MCGIAGLYYRGGYGETEIRQTAAAMTAAVRHRGPDDYGLWIDAGAGVGLGHRRLAIVDLSTGGAQPMVSSCGRFVLTFNGEIYNFRALRQLLEATGQRFRSESDTEVLLEACAVWGVPATAERLYGIFAFALWDRQERQLWLVRDQMGVKPLYWSLDRGCFRFGSELKALRADPDFSPTIDQNALTIFFRGGYVPSPHTIYCQARMLPPGSLLSIGPDDVGMPEPKRYWDILDIAATGQAAPLDWSDAEAIDGLDALLRTVIESQMMSDVPLGAFLSGGIDSSTVVAVMQAVSARPVRSFSIGFREVGFDESRHAAAVARHLGTDHTELVVEPAHALDIVPRLPVLFDEPFADSSQMPTFLVSELTRRSVTVALSGDGGDELFCGYNRYFHGRRLWAMLALVPHRLRGVGGNILRGLPAGLLDGTFRLLPARYRVPQPADKARKLAEVLTLRDFRAVYRRLITHWSESSGLVPGGIEPLGPIDDRALDDRLPDQVAWMQAVDTVTYLPDDILTKIDRASMAVALEARVPLLDPRIVRLAWSLPPRLKVRDGQGKWLLRQVLDRYVPRGLIDRPKMGFGVPIGDWLRGPLRDWAASLLDPAGLTDAGLAPAPVQLAWQEHIRGERNWQYPLWDVLVYRAWHDHWMRASAPIGD